MMPINCIIVEDEPIAAGILEQYIVQYNQQHNKLQLLAKCPNALEAFDVLQQKKVELMFLDIRMPAVSGIQFLKALKDPPKVIFTSAYSEHAIDGFELDVADFLLKPITYERFEKSMEKLFRQESKREKHFSFFKVSGQQVKVNHADIYYAQSVKDYVQIKTSTGSLLTYLTMHELAGQLPAKKFARVHRSYLVNKDYIEIAAKNYLQVGGTHIPLGKTFKRDLLL